MLAIHERCRQRRAVEINGRAGNESGSADAQCKAAAAGGYSRRHKCLVQEWDRVQRWCAGIDLNAQCIVCCYAGRVG
jgi:hypothetical protein